MIQKLQKDKNLLVQVTDLVSKIIKNLLKISRDKENRFQH
jgi:hypothetical protein